MTVLVVMIDALEPEAGLDVKSAERLADLGISHVTIVRDHRVQAVILDGWAFDAYSSGVEARSIVAGDSPSSVLLPVFQTVLSQRPTTVGRWNSAETRLDLSDKKETI